MTLLDDVQELRPTIFLSVPRLYNRIYDRVMGAIRSSNPISRKLFETAYAYKKAALARGDLSGGHFGPFWDRLVFSKVKARLGGKQPAAGNCRETCMAGMRTVECRDILFMLAQY